MQDARLNLFGLVSVNLKKWERLLLDRDTVYVRNMGTLVNCSSANSSGRWKKRISNCVKK